MKFQTENFIQSIMGPTKKICILGPNQKRQSHLQSEPSFSFIARSGATGA